MVHMVPCQKLSKSSVVYFPYFQSSTASPQVSRVRSNGGKHIFRHWRSERCIGRRSSGSKQHRELADLLVYLCGSLCLRSGRNFLRLQSSKARAGGRHGSQEKLRRMNWIRSFLIAAGLVLLVIALQYSRNPYGWNDGHVLGPFISGLLCLAAFSVWEWKGTSSGVLDHRLFCGRDFPRLL